MKRPAISDRGWLWLRFTSGIAYLGILSVFLGLATNASIPKTFAFVLVGATLATILGLTWLALWARRAESKLGQFQIGSLLFLTALVAMLFGAARWTAGRVVRQYHAPVDNVESYFILFGVVTVVWLIVAAISLPFVLAIAEAVMWAGVWTLRQPIIRRGIGVLCFQRDRKATNTTIACETPTAPEWRAESSKTVR